MPKRKRDIGRRYQRGSKKRNVKTAKEIEAKKQSGAIEKFILKKNQSEHTDALDSDENINNKTAGRPQVSNNSFDDDEKSRYTGIAADYTISEKEQRGHEELHHATSSREDQHPDHELDDDICIPNYEDPVFWPEHI